MKKFLSLLFILTLAICPIIKADTNKWTKVDDLTFDDYIYLASNVDEIVSSIPSKVDIWGPISYTNQNDYATNYSVTSIGLRTASNAPNMLIYFDPETSTYEFRATSGIPGPQGADGIGNVLWAGNYYPGIYITNSNTWVSYDGSIWYHPPSDSPITSPPTNKAPWSLVVSRGLDGTPGKDGNDGLGLQLTYWSTNLEILSPDMLLSYAGYLLVITNDTAIANPGEPVIEGSPVTKYYKPLVWPGANGTSAEVYTNAMFVIDFNPLNVVPAHSLVVYNGFLWYAKTDYDPSGGNAVPPSEGPNWMIIGKQGPTGPQGMNGIGNLKYCGDWDPRRTNYINDIVRYPRADGKYDWYRAITEPIVEGANPANNTNQWSKEITSGIDANSLDWTIVHGPYDDSVYHSNELYRAPNGIVYYTVSGNPVPPGPGNAPGVEHYGYWDIFVKDGTTVAGTNGVVWRGYWQTSYQYEPGDMVTYDSGTARSLFIANTNIGTESSIGVSPPDVRYWITVASGIQGPEGPKGKDGTATYITNIVTYEGYHTNIVTYVTNDMTTAVVDWNAPTQVYNILKFNPIYFDYNGAGVYSLNESALGVLSLKPGNYNTLNGNIKLNAGSNITFNVNDSTKEITINSHSGLDFIPIGITQGNNLDTHDDYSVSRVLFDYGTGFRVKTNSLDELVISMGSAWTKLYDDDLNFEKPTGEEPLRITTHTNDTKIKWTGTTNIVMTNDNEVVTNSVKVLSVGIGDRPVILPQSGGAVAITNEPAYVTNEIVGNESIFYFGIPVGPKGDDGISGAELIPRGTYEATNTYYTNELVRFFDAQYYVNSSAPEEGITGISPGDIEYASYWSLFLKDGAGSGGQWDIDLEGNLSPAIDQYSGDWDYDNDGNLMPPLEISEGGGGGGGTSVQTMRVATNNINEVLGNDYLIWMDPSFVETNQMLTLPDMDSASQTIIVRQFGNEWNTTIRRVINDITNDYVLSGDGDGITIDWFGIATNWYWRNY